MHAHGAGARPVLAACVSCPSCVGQTVSPVHVHVARRRCNAWSHSCALAPHTRSAHLSIVVGVPFLQKNVAKKRRTRAKPSAAVGRMTLDTASCTRADGTWSRVLTNLSTVDLNAFFEVCSFSVEQCADVRRERNTRIINDTAAEAKRPRSLVKEARPPRRRPTPAAVPPQQRQRDQGQLGQPPKLLEDRRRRLHQPLPQGRHAHPAPRRGSKQATCRGARLHP